MSDVASLTERYEKAVKRKDAVAVRVQKIETAREVAAAKIKDLESKIRTLGVDPEKVDEWLEKESARITSELSQTEKELDEAERALLQIETSLKTVNG